MSRILIIEDEAILADMYRDKFEEAGFQIDLAFSFEEAINYLKDKKPDLILLDILLPRGNGISFLKEIKKIKETTDIPIVAFSNYDDPITKQEAFELGVRDYLIKTQYTPKELLKEIKKFLPKNNPHLQKTK